MADICQSCAMPFKQDPAGGGTTADGLISTEYCSYCYADGVFLAPDVTVKQMQQIAIDAMKRKGFPRPIGWLLTRNIPKLKRWKTTP
tara:strand:+ start:923 stop:1183 length:261 start_codon:yes stop_codon:yes gene_type:complete